MDQAALDGHVNHLRTVIRMEHKDDRKAYDALVRGLCVAFQGVAPSDANVKALARRLQKEQFDPEGQDEQNVNRSGNLRQEAAAASATSGQQGGAGQAGATTQNKGTEQANPNRVAGR